MTSKSYQHPRETKSKTGFATYVDHMRVVEVWDAAGARRMAREKKLKEEKYMEKRNERLWVIIVPEGRESLKQNTQYSPIRNPMFNGQDKATGVKHAMELSEVPSLTNIFQHDAWITYLSGHFVRHLASAAGGRQSYANMYVVTLSSLAPCLLHCTRFI
jgi:hypothetical protein